MQPVRVLLDIRVNEFTLFGHDYKTFMGVIIHGVAPLIPTGIELLYDYTLTQWLSCLNLSPDMIEAILIRPQEALQLIAQQRMSFEQLQQAHVDERQQIITVSGVLIAGQRWTVKIKEDAEGAQAHGEMLLLLAKRSA